MNLLGSGLFGEDALTVQEAELSMLRRLSDSEENILAVQSNIASTYQTLGQFEKALGMEQEIYNKKVVLMGNLNPSTLIAAICLANTLSKMRRFDEVRNFAPDRIAACQRVLGAEHENTLFLRTIYARALFFEDDPEQAETILVDVSRIARRVLGPSHCRTVAAEHELGFVRAPGEVCSAFDFYGAK